MHDVCILCSTYTCLCVCHKKYVAEKVHHGKNLPNLLQEIFLPGRKAHAFYRFPRTTD